jgi:hypothetical protein
VASVTIGKPGSQTDSDPLRKLEKS